MKTSGPSAISDAVSPPCFPSTACLFPAFPPPTTVSRWGSSCYAPSKTGMFRGGLCLHCGNCSAPGAKTPHALPPAKPLWASYAAWKTTASSSRLPPNLAGLAEADSSLHPGQAVSVYIKNILPDKMKIKLVVVNKNLSQPLRFEPHYFVVNPWPTEEVDLFHAPEPQTDRDHFLNLHFFPAVSCHCADRCV